MSLLRSLAAVIAALVITTSAAKAELVSISAFSNPFNQVLTTNSTVSGSNWFTVGFTTGTSPDFLSLTGVKLSLATSGTTVSTNPIVRLFSGVSNPTTEVTTLIGSTLSSALPSTATFTPSSSPLSLSPGTNYWVVLSAGAGDAYGWYSTDENPAEQNGSGYSFVAGRRSTNAGSSWSNNVVVAVSAVSVEVLAVPEPPTIMLAGLGVVGVVVADRTRRLRRSRVTSTGDEMANDSNVDG
jgi:hypothetical protein